MNIIEALKRVVRRVIVVSVNKDDKNTQTVRVSYFGKVINVDLFNSYGVASNPPKDGMGVMFEVEGQTDNRIAMIGTPTGIRIKELKEGEVVIGNFKNGTVVRFLDDTMDVIAPNTLNINVTGNATITAPQVDIDSPQVNMTGDLDVDGVITAPNIVGTTDVTADGVSLKNHDHDYVGLPTGNNGTTTTPN